MPVKGIFWINPMTGDVLKTRIELSAEWESRYTNSASITVTYKEDRELNLLVPALMTESYEGPTIVNGEQRIWRTSCRATYSNFKRFETSGRMVPRSSSVSLDC